MNFMKIYKSNVPEFSLKRIPSDIPKVQLLNSKDVVVYAKKFYHDDIEIWESFFIILMNIKNNTIGWVKIGQGGLSGTVVDPILVAKFAVSALAKHVILVHNHPSGGTQPSDADKNLTEKIKTSLNLFDISVLDHVIITASDNYYSFADEGKL